MRQSHPSPTSPRIPGDPVASLIKVSRYLQETVEQETALLRAHKPLSIGDLQPQKQQLASDYALHTVSLSENPDILDRAPAREVENLRQVLEGLHHSLAENEEILKATKSVSESILHKAADIVAEQQSPATAYGSKAQAPAPSTHKPAALSLDQKV